MIVCRFGFVTFFIGFLIFNLKIQNISLIKKYHFVYTFLLV